MGLHLVQFHCQTLPRWERGQLLCRFLRADFFSPTWLGSTTWSFRECGFNLFDGFRLGAALHRRNLTRQPVKRGVIELTVRVSLLSLGVGKQCRRN